MHKESLVFLLKASRLFPDLFSQVNTIYFLEKWWKSLWNSITQCWSSWTFFNKATYITYRYITIVIFNPSVIAVERIALFHGLLKVQSRFFMACWKYLVDAFTLLNVLLMFVGWRVSRIMSSHCTQFKNKTYYCIHRASLSLTVYSLTEVTPIIRAKRHGA